jgi:hypothetical protein
MDLRVATNDPPSAERHLYSLGDHLRVRRFCYWHHGIYVGADRWCSSAVSSPTSRIPASTRWGCRNSTEATGLRLSRSSRSGSAFGTSHRPFRPRRSSDAHGGWRTGVSRARTTWSAGTVRRPRSGACATWARASSDSGSKRQCLSRRSRRTGLRVSPRTQARPCLGDEGDPRVPGCPIGAAGHVLPAQRALLSGRSPVLHGTHGSRVRATASLSQRW